MESILPALSQSSTQYLKRDFILVELMKQAQRSSVTCSRSSSYSVAVLKLEPRPDTNTLFPKKIIIILFLFLQSNHYILKYYLANLFNFVNNFCLPGTAHRGRGLRLICLMIDSQASGIISGT